MIAAIARSFSGFSDVQRGFHTRGIECGVRGLTPGTKGPAIVGTQATKKRPLVLV